MIRSWSILDWSDIILVLVKTLYKTGIGLYNNRLVLVRIGQNEVKTIRGVIPPNLIQVNLCLSYYGVYKEAILAYINRGLV